MKGTIQMANDTISFVSLTPPSLLPHSPLTPLKKRNMKQILLINDVVGYSHVGMVAMLPILTQMGHTTYNLPTALVSNTLDYGHFNVLETTDYMRGTIPVWRQLGFRFDAVCTGLMFSEEQATLVSSYCRQLQREGTTVSSCEHGL